MESTAGRAGFGMSNGVRLHYLDWGGDGPALVFLAGRGCNAHIFDDFAPLFTGHFHVFGLTRRGHGESDYPESGYDIDTLVDDLRQSLDGLQIEQAILAGHSMAGIELTHFAALFPERVLKLVFLEAGYDYGSPEYKAMMEKNPIFKIPVPGAEQDFFSVADYAAFLRFAYPALGSIWGDLLEAHLGYEVRTEADGRVVDKMSDEIDRAISETISAYRPEFAKIRAPTMAIYALKRNTYYVSSEYMSLEQQVEVIEFFNHVVEPLNEKSIEQFRREVPQAEIVKIPDGHHYCHIQQKELVFKEMMGFLLEEG